jgi:hypothetical protein
LGLKTKFDALKSKLHPAYAEPVLRDARWIEPHLASAEDAMAAVGADGRSFR